MNPQKRAPGKSHQNGISLIELMEMFPDEYSARKWFESIIWEDGGAVCHRCGGTNTYEVAGGKPLPYRCRDCRKHFSFRHGTLLEDSHVPLRKWAIAIYLVGHKSEGGVVDETASGPEHYPEDSLAHTAQDPLCDQRQQWYFDVRHSGGGRNLRRWFGAQQTRIRQTEGRVRQRRQDCGGWHQRNADLSRSAPR